MSPYEPATSIALRLAAIHQANVDARSPLATHAALAGAELNRAVLAARDAGVEVAAVIAGALEHFTAARIAEERKDADATRRAAVRGAMQRIAAAVAREVEKEEAIQRGA